LPEEWLIERIQQVGANSCNLLSPAFIAICGSFAAVFCNLRYIFVTASRSNERNQSAIQSFAKTARELSMSSV
jgi:hypothetical protein